MSNDDATTADRTQRIRPTVRRRCGGGGAGAGAGGASSPSDVPKPAGGAGGGSSSAGDLDSLPEGTRRRMASASTGASARASAGLGKVRDGRAIPSPPTSSGGSGGGSHTAAAPGGGGKDRPVAAGRQQGQQQRPKPRGILREPKYSTTSSASPPSRASAHRQRRDGGPPAAAAAILSSAHDGPTAAGFSPAIVLPSPPVIAAADPSPDDSDPSRGFDGAGRGGHEERVEDLGRPAVRDVVVERHPRAVAAAAAASARRFAAAASGARPAAPSSSAAAIAVEGYAPSTDGGSLPPPPSRKKDGARPPTVTESASDPSAEASVPPSSTSRESPRPSDPPHGSQDGPTIVRSVSELIALARRTSSEAAGGIEPSGVRTEDGGGGGGGDDDGDDEVAIEADVSFACMTEDEYRKTLDLAQTLRRGGDRAKEEESGIVRKGGETDDETFDGDDDSGQVADPNDVEEGDLFDEQEYDEGGGPTMEEVFFGRRDIFGPDDDDEGGAAVDDEDEGEGSFLDFFSNDDDDSIGEAEPEPRPFLLLWRALSAWTTPDAADILAGWAGAQGSVQSGAAAADSLRPPYDRTDVGASRCAGLMSMLKMNLPRSLEELGYDRTDGHVRRLAEGRLAAFVRSFNFTEPMTKFDSKMWRAMTLILVDICLPASVLYPDVVATSNRTDGHGSYADNVPSTIKSLEISIEEYRYLTTEAIRSLSKGGS